MTEEEQKIPNAEIDSPQFESNIVPQWQWQSDANPWEHKDPAKWTWQSYSPDVCIALEKAYFLNQEIADLGDYEVDLKKMLQVNKNLRNQIRRVKRQERSRFMIEMPEPTIIPKNQKTMHEAFGTVQHFLDYIMKRTPEAYELYLKLKKMPLDGNNTELERIIQDVVVCIKKGAEARLKIVKTRSKSQTQDFTFEAEIIIGEIKSSKNLRDFLNTILKVYTMESFICYWLNELLRSEDWEEINVLTPYLVCLVYTFKLSDYTIKYEEPKGFMNSLKSLVSKQQKLCLYRGTALSKLHLALYYMQKMKYFSWNGVTSTSRSQKVALDFIKMSLERAKKQGNNTKVGAVFVIETDFASIQDCEGMIDISQNSRYPEEQEVILAPGTVFELGKTIMIDNNIYEISLKIKRKFQETTRSQEIIPLLGDLQDQAITNEKAVIKGLPSRESFKLLQLLEGNKLIQKLEISNSEINEHMMKIIEEMRISTNLKKQDIILHGNNITVNSLSLLAYYYSEESLNFICISNKIIWTDNFLANKEWRIKNLILTEQVFGIFQQQKGQIKELLHKIKQEDQIITLSLSMQNLKISNQEFQSLLEYIQHLKSLENLTLSLNLNNAENLIYLYKALGSFSSLQQISLPFIQCKVEVSDEGLVPLKNELHSLIAVESLSLNFEGSDQLSEKELKHLKGAILPLKSLQSLSLDFRNCKEISDQGLSHFKNALESLVFLKSLSLNFYYCLKISDKGLRHLKDALLCMKSLEELSMDFYYCIEISDEGLSYLKNALTKLGSLQRISINFKGCKEMSDQGISHLKDAFQSLESLQSVSLNFGFCKKITDEGLKSFQSLNLAHLSLNFESCNQISDQGLQYILENHHSLHHLSLDFSSCTNISDEGLAHLATALTFQQSLDSLSLKFKGCNKISNKGFCKIVGIIGSMRLLKNLSLNFSDCNHITDTGFCGMGHFLQPLESLKSLSIDLSCCENLTEKGLNDLKTALSKLNSLEKLSLQFEFCDNISQTARKELRSALKSIPDFQCF